MSNGNTQGCFTRTIFWAYPKAQMVRCQDPKAELSLESHGFLIHLGTNRGINRKNVDGKKESIGTLGYLDQWPVIILPDGTIREGQHRFIACMEMGFPFAFTVADGLDIPTIRQLGKTNVPWSEDDQLSLECERGNARALTIRGLMDEFKCRQRVARAALLADRHATFSDGEFSPEQVETARQVLQEMDSFSGIASRAQIYGTPHLISAYLKLRSLDGFDLARWRERMVAYGKAMYAHHNRQEAALVNLIDIYNYNTKQVNRLNIPNNVRLSRG